MVKDIGLKKVNVGEHMSIHVGHFRNPLSKELEDHTIIKAVKKIGIIDIERNLPKLSEKESLVGITRMLFRETESDLKELALMCKAGDPRLEGLDIFHGVSHLAGPLAKRLGFDVYDIANPVERVASSLIGRLISSDVGAKNEEWRKYQSKFKSAREAYISRSKLIRLYSDK